MLCERAQCSTLNRSDEVVSLLMACIQPFCVRLPHHTAHNGQISPLSQEVFGVLGLFHETKTAQPGVSRFSSQYSYNTPYKMEERSDKMYHYRWGQRSELMPAM